MDLTETLRICTICSVQLLQSHSATDEEKFSVLFYQSPLVWHSEELGYRAYFQVVEERVWEGPIGSSNVQGWKRGKQAFNRGLQCVLRVLYSNFYQYLECFNSEAWLWDQIVNHKVVVVTTRNKVGAICAKIALELFWSEVGFQSMERNAEKVNGYRK